MFRKLAAASAALACLVMPTLAHATAAYRVEWVRAAPSDFQAGAVVNQVGEVDGTAQDLTVTGSTPTLSAAAPSFGPAGAPVYVGYARVTVTSGAVVCVAGASPVASEAAGAWIGQGPKPAFLKIATGQKLSCVEATSGAAALDANNASYSAASQLTVGGAAVAATRGIAADCTAAGVATLTMAGSGALSWSVGVGHQNQPYSVTGVASSTATCTFYGLK